MSDDTKLDENATKFVELPDEITLETCAKPFWLINLTLEINNIIEEVISNELVETTKEIPKTKEIQNTKESEKKTNDKNNNSNNKSSSNSKKNTNQKNKPPNKDFLFKDGYNINNVSQAAYEYLNSSGFAGECRPIKDDDGIYLGMRVIFY